MVNAETAPTISIIVPIYNTENFLEDCVISILKQSYTNLEVILVNNGSTDASRSICEKFEDKDKRVKVINKEHGSISSGRNKGLEEVTGDYVAFVDSDDILDKDIIKVLYNTAISTNADISICKALRMYNDKIEERNNSNTISTFNQEGAVFAWLCQHKFGNEVWAKLYKRDCVSSVLFREQQCEDMCFLFDAIRNSERISVIESYRYYYRMHRLYSERTSYRRPVEDEKVDVLSEFAEVVSIDYPNIYNKFFAAACESILSSVMRIYGADKVKNQKVYLDSATGFFNRKRIEILQNIEISKQNKRLMLLFCRHKNVFNIAFKIRNTIKG